MKIHSIYFRDFRSFRGEVTIDFCDPLSGTPRPITALAGTNGSGKSTVLEAIEALIRYAFASRSKHSGSVLAPIIEEAWTGGLIVLTFAPTVAEGGRDQLTLNIGVGKADLLPPDHKQRWPNLIPYVASQQIDSVDFPRSFMLLEKAHRDLEGGILSFPSIRRLGVNPAGPIQPPPDTGQLSERVEDQTEWVGSLEQQWVWQNYLDLEQGVRTGKNLRPYVERVEHLLGSGRRIFIEQGRVYVTQADPARKPVRLDQLPSGEKQILLLLGEIARRGRPGMVCLIDEPEISLHPAMQHALIHAFRSYAREEDTQFILGTHSMEIVSALPGAVHFLDRLDAGKSPSASTVADEAA